MEVVQNKPESFHGCINSPRSTATPGCALFSAISWKGRRFSLCPPAYPEFAKGSEPGSILGWQWVSLNFLFLSGRSF